ncbi:MAG: hypothetical protein LBV50_06000 [Novosphingobium sp.]|jgi:Sec-independent protein translocase protein TatA|nr:hypothetical protein [Novosphingobium sp.]
MKDQSQQPGGFPYVSLVLLALACFFYLGVAVSALEPGDSDAAGRGMALGFAFVFCIPLWILLAALFAIAASMGRMPGYAATAAVLLPLSAFAAMSAIGLYDDDKYGAWLIAAPLLLPPLWALYALWGRLPQWHDRFAAGPTTALLGGAVLVLTVVPLVLMGIEAMPDPKRDAARAAERVAQGKAQEEEEEKRRQEADAEDAARFGRLGPDSPLADYLEYLPPGHPRSEAAVAGARRVKSRNRDAAMLLKAGRIGNLAELWRLDVDPTVVCGDYGGAFKAEAWKITRARSDYDSVEGHLELQLPNVEWLVGAHCDLGEALGEAEARVRAVSDSPRENKFADTLSALRRRR